ncbi:MAG: class I SAM-dependent methyltransferase [bacterium]|nr:class I SAM-dependent methyltransferase [bacterium]
MHERLLFWWGSCHIGEVIRRCAIRRVLDPFPHSGMRILDAGCGRGDNALWFARRFTDGAVHAVDLDPELVACVRQRVVDAGLRNISVQQADIEQFESDARYGIIYSVDVFEHLKDPAAALTRIAHVLERGGWCVIHVPRAAQRRWFRRFDRYEQHDHARDGFEPEELTVLMRAAGLTVQDIRHTFGPPGALAWELFHLAQGIGKWFALLTYPIPRFFAWVDGWVRWKRGNGMLIVSRKPTAASDKP